MKKEYKVSIKVPIKGEKKKILDMVHKNAKHDLEMFKIKHKVDKQMQNML